MNVHMFQCVLTFMFQYFVNCSIAENYIVLSPATAIGVAAPCLPFMPAN